MEGEKFCTQCGTVRATASERQPSAGAPRKPMSRRAKFTYLGVALTLAAAFGYMFIDHLPGKANPIIKQQPIIAMPSMYGGDPIEQVTINAEVRNGQIIIPLATVLDKKLVAFEYAAADLPVPLLAYINTDGSLVTAFGFCEPCNSRTYRIEGTELACGNCETKWKLNNLEGIQGSCQKYPPDPIPSEVVGTEIRINESVAKNWKIRL